MKPHFDNLTPLSHAAQNRCFGCGEANQHGLQLEFLLAQDGTVVCPVRARGLTAMTRHLEVDYRRPVPSCTPIRLEGRIVRDEGRKHFVEANIYDADSTILAHGKGVFIEVRPSRPSSNP